MASFTLISLRMMLFLIRIVIRIQEVTVKVSDRYSNSEHPRRDEVTFRLCYLLIVKSQGSHLTFLSFIFLTCKIDLVSSNLKVILCLNFL